jgi:hypothetical protein
LCWKVRSIEIPNPVCITCFFHSSRF